MKSYTGLHESFPTYPQMATVGHHQFIVCLYASTIFSYLFSVMKMFVAMT